jgi:competence protein ComEC
VLRVSTGAYSLLLPGDIERSAELRLWNHPALTRTTVLLAPHHGSRSSSSAAFVATAMPEAVIYTSGYRNRFRHPHADVRARYVAAGSREYLTSVSGALEFDISPNGLQPIRERRRDRPRFWAYPP